MANKSLIVLFAVMSVLVCSLCFGLVITYNDGKWPETWPKELETYRKLAKTYDVACGTQQTVYEIPFDSTKEFEKDWPYILTLKSKGATLILEKSPSKFFVSESSVEAGVRILCASGGTSQTQDAKKLRAGPPWPDYIRSEDGELPEYVVSENGRWVPFSKDNDRLCVKHRARVDIVLIVDGEIVDLNRIPLPANTTIIDNRFKDMGQQKTNEENQEK